ncbi:Rpn family recombination-promoting nuclease/putative transposase [Butyricimonas synergistica]|uniref:Rpn family recombination-promoting nuclease/putative transposase n=1 Tax=Butyricimonas synergistica TaxID=544644 RepID=UPI00037F74E2|nr:Rpn family recombination-promoting nuclease/putative transposase [Butyricimonas synergistica]
MGSEGLLERYINPYTDFGFKKLFGTDMNKDLLISFLNALLHGEQSIKDITYLNTEHLGTQEIDRRAVFDVYCENEQGEKFLVEIQKGEQQFFKDRSLFYSTFPIREQAVKGKSWDYELKAIYTIGILNFTFDDKDNYYHHEVKLLDTRTKEVFYDKLTFIYLEMPKFNKSELELETMFDKWMFVLRNLSGLMERPAALQERVFERLFKAAEIAGFSKRELYEYEDSLKVFRDWYSVVKTAEKKGHVKGYEEGEKKGFKEGEKKKQQEIARNLKTMGLSPDAIIKATGLSSGEIEEI